MISHGLGDGNEDQDFVAEEDIYDNLMQRSNVFAPRHRSLRTLKTKPHLGSNENLERALLEEEHSSSEEEQTEEEECMTTSEKSGRQPAKKEEPVTNSPVGFHVFSALRACFAETTGAESGFVPDLASKEEPKAPPPKLPRWETEEPSISVEEADYYYLKKRKHFSNWDRMDDFCIKRVTKIGEKNPHRCKKAGSSASRLFPQQQGDANTSANVCNIPATVCEEGTPAGEGRMTRAGDMMAGSDINRLGITDSKKPRKSERVYEGIKEEKIRNGMPAAGVAPPSLGQPETLFAPTPAARQAALESLPEGLRHLRLEAEYEEEIRKNWGKICRHCKESARPGASSVDRDRWMEARGLEDVQNASRTVADERRAFIDKLVGELSTSHTGPRAERDLQESSPSEGELNSGIAEHAPGDVAGSCSDEELEDDEESVRKNINWSEKWSEKTPTSDSMVQDYGIFFSPSSGSQST